MFFGFLMFFIKLIFILLSIAFITLFERKLLGFSQLRLGPNKVNFIGITQPVLDGIKLFLKEIYFPKKFLFFGVFVGPSLGFLVMLFLWVIFLSKNNFYMVNFMLIFIMIFIGLSVYSSLISGWSGTSKFSSIGGIRSCSQSVSYEICLVFFLFCVLMMMNSVFIYNKFYFISLFLFMFLFFNCVAETNRAPFDFSEGESELISGFNIEFGSGGFVLLFLAEYGMIIFFSMLLSLFFFKTLFFCFFLMMFIFIFIRSVYPRFRYDMLMKMMWMKFLPISLLLIWFYIVMI